MISLTNDAIDTINLQTPATRYDLLQHQLFTFFMKNQVVSQCPYIDQIFINVGRMNFLLGFRYVPPEKARFTFACGRLVKVFRSNIT